MNIKLTVVIVTILIFCLVFIGFHFNDALTLGGIACLEILAISLELVYNKIKKYNE